MKVIKAGKGKTFHIFQDIIGEILFSSEKTMFLLVNLKAGQVVPEHRHPHEQMGVCLKGKAELVVGGKKFLVDSGSFYWMKPNEFHKVNVLESGTFLDVFSPPREDYLKKISMQKE
jgi:quercetin dioxygenase-like cupin family protein